MADAVGWPERVELDELVLRRAVQADLPTYCERIYADVAVMRMLPGRVPVTGPAAIERASGPLIAHWEQHGFGPWLVTDATSGRIHGHAGIRFWPDSHDVEVLYALEPPAWGRSIATRASGFAVSTGFELLDLERIIGAVVPGNHGSARVLDKLGLRATDLRRFGDLEVQMFELTRADWSARG